MTDPESKGLAVQGLSFLHRNPAPWWPWPGPQSLQLIQGIQGMVGPDSMTNSSHDMLKNQKNKMNSPPLWTRNPAIVWAIFDDFCEIENYQQRLNVLVIQGRWVHGSSYLRNSAWNPSRCQSVSLALWKRNSRNIMYWVFDDEHVNQFILCTVVCLLATSDRYNQTKTE